MVMVNDGDDEDEAEDEDDEADEDEEAEDEDDEEDGTDHQNARNSPPACAIIARASLKRAQEHNRKHQCKEHHPLVP